MQKLIQLTLGAAMNCEQRQEVITRITQELDESTMQELQMILEQVIEEYLPAVNVSYNYGGDPDSVNISGGPCNNSLTREFFNLSGNGAA